MTIKPEEILSLAEQLLADANYKDECSSRALIGRAYYASFHQAKLVIKKYLLPESLQTATGSHQRELNKLIDCRQLHGKDKWTTISSMGSMAANILNPLRTKADYHLDKEITEDDIAETMARARKIQQQAKTLLE